MPLLESIQATQRKEASAHTRTQALARSHARTHQHTNALTDAVIPQYSPLRYKCSNIHQASVFSSDSCAAMKAQCRSTMRPPTAPSPAAGHRSADFDDAILPRCSQRAARTAAAVPCALEGFSSRAQAETEFDRLRNLCIACQRRRITWAGAADDPVSQAKSVPVAAHPACCSSP